MAPGRHMALHRRNKAACCVSAINIRKAALLDYWAVADCHCTVFYPDAEAASGLKRLWSRLDRVLALQINDSLVEANQGKAVVLAAFDASSRPGEQVRNDPSTTALPEGASYADVEFPSTSTFNSAPGGLPSPQQFSETQGPSTNPSGSPPGAAPLPSLLTALNARPGAAPYSSSLFWIKYLLKPGVQEGIDSDYQQSGILGAVCVDTFGDMVPPKTLTLPRDKTIGWKKRAGKPKAVGLYCSLQYCKG